MKYSNDIFHHAYLFLADFLIERYFMVPGYDNLVGVWQGAQPFVELSNLMKLPKLLVRLVAFIEERLP